MSFLVHSGRSPGMMLLCLSTCRIYNTIRILIPGRKKKQAIVLYSFWFTQVEVLGNMFFYMSASRIYNTLSILIRSRKKKLGGCSMSFLVCPGRIPEMMLLCLSACSIYNTLSISNRSRKKKIRQLFYILSGSPRQKSLHDVIMPERFQDI